MVAVVIAAAISEKHSNKQLPLCISCQFSDCGHLSRLRSLTSDPVGDGRLT
jgi:hypothetical protein